MSDNEIGIQKFKGIMVDFMYRINTKYKKYVSFEQNKSKSLISQPSKEEITNVICTFCPSDFVEDTAEHKRERRKHGLISF